MMSRGFSAERLLCPDGRDGWLGLTLLESRC
jgi:hypothetical protein